MPARALFPLLMVSPSVLAEAAAPLPVSSGWSVFQALLGLALVLAAIYFSAWLLRRFAPGQALPGGGIRVIGGVAVGPKERLVVVEVADTWLVVGVAPGSVTPVHQMARPEGGAEAVSAPPPAFAVWLKQAMQGRRA